ncbi:hypothetical protein ES703_100511 [subsurface metagenome]
MLVNNDYIRGLFDGEGTARLAKDRRRRHCQPRIQITNICLPVLQEVKQCLLSQGYKHVYLGRKNTNANPLHYRPCYDIIISSRADCLKFVEEIGANIPSKLAKLKEIEAHCRFYLAKKGKIPETVTEILNRY